MTATSMSLLSRLHESDDDAGRLVELYSRSFAVGSAAWASRSPTTMILYGMCSLSSFADFRISDTTSEQGHFACCARRRQCPRL